MDPRRAKSEATPPLSFRRPLPGGGFGPPSGAFASPGPAAGAGRGAPPSTAEKNQAPGAQPPKTNNYP